MCFRKDYVYTIDEKMGQTYIHHECANTIAQRDYKQPQAVVVRRSYGLEPGAAQRMDPHKRIWKERSPTLRANAGDNQASVIITREERDDEDKEGSE